MASFSSPPGICQVAVEALFAVTDARLALLHAEAIYKQGLARLDELVEQGLLATENLPAVNGFTIYRQQGRTSWSYPDSIRQLEAHVKQQKKLCEQLGEASQKQGNPFWTVKEAEKVF